MAHLPRIGARMAELLASAASGGEQAVVCGDFNVVRSRADIKNWTSNHNKRAGVLDEEIAFLNRWVEEGWHDVVRDLAGQVQIEAGEHAQRGGVLVAGRDRPQRVRHGAGRASDHGCVALVRLGRPGRQVGDAPHRQARQVAHSDAHVLGHRHRQGPDGGRLIDHHQHLPLCLQALVDLTQPVLVVG